MIFLQFANCSRFASHAGSGSAAEEPWAQPGSTRAVLIGPTEKTPTPGTARGRNAPQARWQLLCNVFRRGARVGRTGLTRQTGRKAGLHAAQRRPKGEAQGSAEYNQVIDAPQARWQLLCNVFRRGAGVGRTGLTRNQVIAHAIRGFESHPLRQISQRPEKCAGCYWTTHSPHNTSACSRTNSVARSCLSGG